MILISHRGNINGPNPERENSPKYIDEALNAGYQVEVDLWVIEGSLFLGHDEPQYGIDLPWLNQRCDDLWLHCKNIEALEYLNILPFDCFHHFWHENDTATITSQRWIWAYPGKQPIKYSIAVMPELYNDDLSECRGICSDYIQNYK